MLTNIVTLFTIFPEINSFHVMGCYIKNKRVNVTNNLQSILYLCFLISGCVNHTACGANMRNS